MWEPLLEIVIEKKKLQTSIFWNFVPIKILHKINRNILELGEREILVLFINYLGRYHYECGRSSRIIYYAYLLKIMSIIKSLSRTDKVISNKTNMVCSQVSFSTNIMCN